MARISIFIITKNESEDIADCLDSVRGFADEIVVVDDESTDDTRSICERLGAKVLSRKLDGFAAQKQFALDQTTGDWAFSIDADERVSPELAQQIRKTTEEAQAAAGYRVRREMYFLGHRLRYGGVGTDWPLRLLKRGKGRYVPTRVHERIEVDGPVEKLDAPLAHYSYRSIEEYVEKANRYTSLAAEDLNSRGRRYSVLDHLRPSWELFSRVVLKGAWLDGRPGLTYAALSSHTAWLRNTKLWALQKNARG